MLEQMLSWTTKNRFGLRKLTLLKGHFMHMIVRYFVCFSYFVLFCLDCRYDARKLSNTLNNENIAEG